MPIFEKVDYWGLKDPLEVRVQHKTLVLYAGHLFQPFGTKKSRPGWQEGPKTAKIGPNMPNMHIWVHIWARKIWSSGVSLKRSCKMQFRRVGLRSIGPSSQKL